MSRWILVYTTIDQYIVAENISRYLVEHHLAASVQIEGPIKSYYRWEGAFEVTKEWRCVIKTGADLYPAVQQAIRRLHPYQVPEIFSLPILDVLPDYEAWLEESTSEGVLPRSDTSRL